MKTQMKFQKIMCLVMLILGALSVAFALSYTTGGLSALGATYVNNSTGYYPDPDLPEAVLYSTVQDFNDTLLYLSIALVVAAALLYITSTNKRRNYYISNYVAIGIVCVLGIVVAIYAMVKNAGYYADFKEILNNADAMANWKYMVTEYIDGLYNTDYNASAAVAYSESAIMFILCFVLYIVYIIACIVLALNAVWKTLLMKGEKQLLSKSFAEEVA